MEAMIYIHQSKTGVSREIPYNSGEFVIRWKKFCDRCKKENGFPKLTKYDYVFFNPNTDRTYPYSQYNLAWKNSREYLSLLLSPIR